jgi:hypothetical protein
MFQSVFKFFSVSKKVAPPLYSQLVYLSLADQSGQPVTSSQPEVVTVRSA